MKIEYRDIEAVMPYENNPRDNRRAVDLVAGSIDNYGFLQPVVISPDGTVIVGHTRLEAARKLGLKQIPVVIADNLTEEQANAYRIVDNKVGELSYWDIDLLNDELKHISKEQAATAGFQIEETGVFDLVMAGDFIPEGSDKTTFAMTLNFTKDEYDIVNRFVEENGKPALADLVVELSKEESDA